MTIIRPNVNVILYSLSNACKSSLLRSSHFLVTLAVLAASRCSQSATEAIASLSLLRARLSCCELDGQRWGCPRFRWRLSRSAFSFFNLDL